MSREQIKEKFSTYLFQVPGFLSGAARVLDMGAELEIYNYSEDEDTADYNALYQDWLSVNNELLNNTKHFAEQNNLSVFHA